MQDVLPGDKFVLGSAIGMRAARAEEHGTPVSTVQNSSAQSAVKGRPGTAISPTVPIRNRSQTIITRRRRKRSARPESSGPPAIGGR